MKLDLITNKAKTDEGVNPNDEFYTPIYAIEPLLKYIPKESKIWCPFDIEESNYVKIFSSNGYSVSHSHISEGYDFF